MSGLAPVIPDSAPFNAAERAWLNGWLAGYYALAAPNGAGPSPPVTGAPEGSGAKDWPWHDMTMPLAERLGRASGRPIGEQLMAAMAQQDCGQCGYVCETYAAAIASGAETNLARCVPGGRETARALRELMESGPAPAAAPKAQAGPPAADPDVALARLQAVLPLNRPGSGKDTRHVVLDLEEAGIDYEVGDALGVKPENCSETTAAIIVALGASADDEVECAGGKRVSLSEALAAFCDITRVADAAIEVLASRASAEADAERLQALAEGYPGAGPEEADLLELLITFPSARPPVQELISALSPLQPRLYSISSSPKVVGRSAHLTVAAVRYETRGRKRTGVASGYLADRSPLGATVPVFVRKSPEFRLPADGTAPVIMIGPGTGVAPFRGFLQERRALGAQGRNWLFFGDQHRAFDFLYEEELVQFHRGGLLTELDLAFSRDQPERVYVQQRMRERAPDLWAWLDAGAHLFVCGAAAMARDVEAGLVAIIGRQGGMGAAAARSYLAKLVADKRYQRDVY